MAIVIGGLGMLLVSSDPDSGHPAQESEVGTTIHDTLIMGTAEFMDGDVGDI